MRIVIDLQGAQSASRHRGIGRYSLALARAMIRLGRDHEFIIALNALFDTTIEPIRAFFDDILSQESIRLWTAVGPVSSVNPANLWRRTAAELEREAFLLSLKPDIVYVSSLMEGFDDDAVLSVQRIANSYCTAVTFYDVIPLLQRGPYLSPDSPFEKAYLEKIEQLRKANLFFAISESSKREAISHLGVNTHCVTSIAAAVDAHFYPISVNAAAEAAIRHRLGLHKRFILYSGATDERKNHLRLIKAFSMLPQKLLKEFQLAIVGGLPRLHQEKFRTQAVACGLTEEEVVITGGVTDPELHQLYNLCELFVFPSWHEGFGLPALEAMACGAAVIGSNTTSVPEVIGRADALFNPFDEHSIADKITEALTNDLFRQNLKEHGLKKAKQFSWDKSASIVLSRLEQWRQEQLDQAERKAATMPSLPAFLIDLIAASSPASQSTQDLLRTAAAIAQNHPRGNIRQLFIDVSELAQRDSGGGIQRVVRAVLANLLSNKVNDWQLTLVRSIPGVAGYRTAVNFLLTTLGFPSQDLDEPVIEPRNGDAFLLGLDLDWNVVIQEKYLLSLRNLGVRIYFVLYDLIPLTLEFAYPSNWNMRLLQARWLDVAQQHDGVICISRSVADEFRIWISAFGNARPRPLKVGFFHLGADLSGARTGAAVERDSDFVLQAIAQKIAFLAVGALEPRKGHIQTIRAFDMLWSKGIDVALVFVGKKGWSGSTWELEAVVQTLESHPERGRRLFWLEAIGDEYLQKIYEHCDCLLATSLAEGFGLPIIEAAVHGLPTIARNLPVFREVAGKHAQYFDGSEPESLAAAVVEWLSLHGAKAPLAAVEIPYLNWRQSTQMLLDVFLMNKWYYEWRPGKERRFRAVDACFGTEVGDRQAREIVTTGTRGCILRGPNISLEQGVYRITVRGRGSNISGAYAEISMGAPKALLGKAPLKTPDSPLTGILLTFEIMAPDRCKDVQVNIWVETTSNLAISHVEFVSLQHGLEDGVETSGAQLTH